MILRWLIFNTVTVFVSAYLLQYYSALEWLIRNDPTHLSFIIAGIYVLVSGYLGYGIFKGKLDGEFLSWVPSVLLGIGLIGTVIGMKLVFASVDFSDLKSAITEVSVGLGIATTTTAMALSSGLLLDIQRWFSTGEKP